MLNLASIVAKKITNITSPCSSSVNKFHVPKLLEVLVSIKVLIFFPHNPYPPRSGAHKRCLEIFTGFKELGYEVTLLSSTLLSDTKWESSSIQNLEADWVKKVLVYEPTKLDYRFISLIKKFNRFFKRELSLNSLVYSPPGMRQWFTKILQEVKPKVVLINYAFWDGLLNHRKVSSLVRVTETHDLVTLNNQMRQALEKHLPSLPIRIDQVDEKVLQEDFFQRLNLVPSPEEFRIYDQYDYTIAISKKEAELIKQNTYKTKVCLIPMTQEPYYIANQYLNFALLPTGPNPFNLQGYLYFVKRVLPKVLKQIPSFTLQVTGACCKDVLPTEGVLLSGFVPDIKKVYELAKFVVCPVFGGTGQQVKIVEAMAHGVPVIALPASAEMSPIQHGTNGFVASSAEEFADYVVQLWNDRELCHKLGNAAREIISAEFSKSLLLEGLSQIVQ